MKINTSLLLASLFSFCLGFILFFSGCGTGIPGTCPGYTKHPGVVTSHDIDTTRCSKTTGSGSNKKTTYYTCYISSYGASYEYKDKTGSCEIDLAGTSSSKTAAEYKLDSSYPIGKNIHVYLDASGNCGPPVETLQSLTISGIFFLSGSCLILLISLYELIRDLLMEFYSNVMNYYYGIKPEVNNTEDGNKSTEMVVQSVERIDV